MVWLVLLILVVILLIIFPKQTIATLVVIVVGILGTIFYYTDYDDYKRRKRNALIQVTVEYNSLQCGQQYPISIRLTNKGGKTVNKVSYRLEAYRKGHSTNVLRYTESSSDKVLKHGQSNGGCYTMPRYESPRDLFDESYYPKNLEYKIVIKSWS